MVRDYYKYTCLVPNLLLEYCCIPSLKPKNQIVWDSVVSHSENRSPLPWDEQCVFILYNIFFFCIGNSKYSIQASAGLAFFNSSAWNSLIFSVIIEETHDFTEALWLWLSSVYNEASNRNSTFSVTYAFSVSTYSLIYILHHPVYIGSNIIV